MIGREEPSLFVAACEHFLVHLNSSFGAACPGDNRTNPKSSNVLVEEREQVERHNFPDQEVVKLKVEAWLISEISECGDMISGVRLVTASCRHTSRVLTPKIASCLKKIIKEEFERRVFIQ